MTTATTELPGAGLRILLLDNYDSFTYNLYQYLCELGADVEVARNDEITVEEIDGRGGSTASSSAPVPRGRRTPASRMAVIERFGPDDAHPRRLPGPPVHRHGLRRRGHHRGAGARQEVGRRPPRRRASSRACRPPSRPAATTRWRSPASRCRRRWRSRPPRPTGWSWACAIASTRSRASSSTPSRSSPRTA